jgi:hypothetical protein
MVSALEGVRRSFRITDSRPRTQETGSAAIGFGATLTSLPRFMTAGEDLGSTWWVGKHAQNRWNSSEFADFVLVSKSWVPKIPP